MPTIPYPDVPDYPGVPSVPRTGQNVPESTLSIASSMSITLNQSQNEPQWGLYNTDGTPLYTPTEGGTLSVLAFGFTGATAVSSFPIEANNSSEGAAFASFNKVWRPGRPVLTLALSGSETEKSEFLNTLDVACYSTNLYDVVTPDFVWKGTTSPASCTVEQYNYQRSATHGATMLIVDVLLSEVMQVSPDLTNTPINSPQSPSAAGTVNNGNTQTSTPTNVNTSILNSILGN